MIHFKSIKTIYPNGLTWANYDLDDIKYEPWIPAIIELISIIKNESITGWPIIFYNFISSLKSSALYPIMTSFEDWESDYSIGNSIIKFNSQQDTLYDYFTLGVHCTEAGERIYPSRTGKGSRWLFGDQVNRVKCYSDDFLMELLRELSLVGGTIPISGWENSLEYGEKIKHFCSNYQKYLQIAYLLPPSWYLMDRLKYKYWRQLLINSGAIKNFISQTKRGIKCLADDGHECNSLFELEVDNWLCSNNISHEKEPFYPYHSLFNPNKKFRADFKVKNYIIECAGMMNEPEYIYKLNMKEQLANDSKIELIILKPRDLKMLDKIK